MGFAICDEAFKPLFQFSFCSNTTCNDHLVVGSANGLLLFLDGCDDTLFVCNPITREYVEIPRLPKRGCIAGFGVSKISGQYKILCRDQIRSYHVYTLERGGGCWRRIAGPKFYPRMPWGNVIFFNGYLHWLASDLKESLFVCCFDLETEVFTKFSLPPRDNSNDPVKNWCHVRGDYELCVLEGQLCVCDSLKSTGIVIWWMKNYGDTNSWVKACRINRPQIGEVIFPLKLSANGDLLFAINTDNQLVTYNHNTDEYLVNNSFLDRSNDHVYNIITYIPSFLSLTAMGICNVKSLSFCKDHVLS
ncbi:F-box/kelch-repeat protein At3g06240-like [Salvia hispanica]|uniref:F-box/kelch-repeat protein At3g06240-like n=1 Tax=Salvia hispanica TaxID=49212 RepID=UPI0020099DF9|nr:F-box/kelch-repeat protein At3g06240-like [Salvia hispanica]